MMRTRSTIRACDGSVNGVWRQAEEADWDMGKGVWEHGSQGRDDRAGGRGGVLVC